MESSKKVVVVGEVLVEIMADTRGEGFSEPLALTGPFASGAPAIFIDQVAKLGQPCAIVAAVGDDDFGRMARERLRGDGVDVLAVATVSDRPTGTAFVRYRADGSRDFIFNIRHSAAGRLPDSAESRQVLQAADHLHIMGSSLSSPELIALNLSAARAVKDRGGSVSFDPNLRKEIFDAPGTRAAANQILSLTDVFLPSGEELFLLADAGNVADAAEQLLASGIEAVVHKMGADGVHYFDASGDRRVASFKVDEVDPTGAGDCFGGTFVALWLRGVDVDLALTLAAAAGALAVGKRGPMEGTSDPETLLRFAGLDDLTPEDLRRGRH